MRLWQGLGLLTVRQYGCAVRIYGRKLDSCLRGRHGRVGREIEWPRKGVAAGRVHAQAYQHQDRGRKKTGRDDGQSIEPSLRRITDQLRRSGRARLIVGLSYRRIEGSG